MKDTDLSIRYCPSKWHLLLGIIAGLDTLRYRASKWNLLSTIIMGLLTLAIIGMLVLSCVYLPGIFASLEHNLIALLLLLYPMPLYMCISCIVLTIDWWLYSLMALRRTPLLILYDDRMVYHDYLIARYVMVGRGLINLFKKDVFRIPKNEYHVVHYTDVDSFSIDDVLRINYKQDAHPEVKLQYSVLEGVVCMPNKNKLLQELNSRLR